MQVPFFNSLRFKVGVGYIVLVVINIAVTAWAIYNFGRLTLALNTILSENYPNVLVVETMAHAVERHEHAISAILNGDLDSGKTTFESVKEEFYQAFDKANENRTLPDAGPILNDIRSTYEGYVLVADSLYQLAAMNDIPAAKAFYGNIVRPFSQRLSDHCFWLIELNQKEMGRVAQQTKRTSDEAIIAVLFAAIIAIGLSIVTMIQFTKRIIVPAERLTQTVHQIGRGRLDLKIDIHTNDEVGELSREFNKMTERLRKFEELNIEKIVTEKQKSETIVENISDAIIVCDSDSNIQLINHSAEELLRIHEKDVLGHPLSACITDERLLEIFRAPEASSLVNRPYLQFSLNGRQVYLRPRVSEIPAVHGGRSGSVLILQDVTQFKELDKMKSDFMAAVSHEFRTPLTSINMSVDILRQQLLGPLTQAQEDLLQASKQDCERLTKLVRELLQLSKLESGKIEMREELVDVRKVVESTLQPLQLQFKEKGVALKLTMEDEIPSLIGDEQQLSWVISNLVNNALRYTGRGGIVEVKAHRQGESILLHVIDTGRGISPEHLEKIFDKFVQVKQTLDATPGSVGLGLAIAKEIVEM
ncbi:MAG: HAMP domain-containing protein [Ignavibacteriales bacterium]|nr:HAMP domain-containing protein [Ignavibacteriales bacterium]